MSDSTAKFRKNMVCLSYTLKMEIEGTSETSVLIYCNTRHIPEDIYMSSHEVTSYVVPRPATSVETTSSRDKLATHAIVKWGKWLQKIYFDQRKKYSYLRIKIKNK